MNGYVTNIDRETIKNPNFRKVLFTGPHHQLVVMSLNPGEDIGAEVHHVDQFIRIEKGHGVVTMGRKRSRIKADSAFVIPAGTRHNVKNTGTDKLKLYTVYSSPQHRDGAVQRKKTDPEEHI